VTSVRARQLTRSMPCAEAHRQSSVEVQESLDMLLIVGIVIASVVIIARLRVPGGVNAAHLGWMSEQWLAEHRRLAPVPESHS
jgi:hypothetical protein